MEKRVELYHLPRKKWVANQASQTLPTHNRPPIASKITKGRRKGVGSDHATPASSPVNNSSGTTRIAVFSVSGQIILCQVARLFDRSQQPCVQH